MRLRRLWVYSNKPRERNIFLNGKRPDHLGPFYFLLKDERIYKTVNPFVWCQSFVKSNFAFTEAVLPLKLSIALNTMP